MQVAYVTCLTSDDFAPGVIALSQSLTNTACVHPLIVLCSNTLSSSTINHLRSTLTHTSQLVTVPPLPNPYSPSAASPSHWHSAGAFTKLRIWQLDQLGIEFVVYLDADTVLLKNLDHLFDLLYLNHSKVFAAAPDIFPPDKFNAGVLATSTCSDFFQSLLGLASYTESYDGGDTGLLNNVFDKWYKGETQWGFRLEKLTFGYNAQRLMYAYTKKNPAYWNQAVDLHVIHYSSTPKPWERNHQDDHLEKTWWEYFQKSKHHHPDSDSLIDVHNLQRNSKPNEMEFCGLTPNDKIRNLWLEDGLEKLQQWKSIFNLNRKLHQAPAIPKLLHFIWFGDDIPSSFLKNVEAWKVMTDWEVKLWKDFDLKHFEFERHDVDYQFLSPVQKSDIFRLELLKKFGGVYMDCDIEILPWGSQSSEKLTELIFSGVECFLGFSNVGVIEVNNAVIGSVPNHPVISSLLNSVDLNFDASGKNPASVILETTGPGFITRAIAKFTPIELQSTNTIILPADVFYPIPNSWRCLQDSEDLKLFITTRTIAMHRWACSWQKTHKSDFINVPSQSDNFSNISNHEDAKETVLLNILKFLK